MALPEEPGGKPAADFNDASLREPPGVCAENAADERDIAERIDDGGDSRPAAHS
jgi:hypothetical protein